VNVHGLLLKCCVQRDQRDDTLSSPPRRQYNRKVVSGSSRGSEMGGYLLGQVNKMRVPLSAVCDILMVARLVLARRLRWMSQSFGVGDERLYSRGGDVGISVLPDCGQIFTLLVSRLRQEGLQFGVRIV
jgi:hypothetical protein